MRLNVRVDGCQGHGNCYGISPQIFSPDDDGFARVVNDHPSADARADVEEAASNCPVSAISISVED